MIVGVNYTSSIEDTKKMLHKYCLLIEQENIDSLIDTSYEDKF